MKKITTFYIHHKVTAFFTALWLIFMVYITITGFQKDSSHIMAGLVATLVIFVPGAIIIALVCTIISSIVRTFSGIIKTNSTDSNDVEPIIPSYSKSDYAPESASEPEDTVESYVSPDHKFLSTIQWKDTTSNIIVLSCSKIMVSTMLVLHKVVEIRESMFLPRKAV